MEGRVGPTTITPGRGKGPITTRITTLALLTIHDLRYIIIIVYLTLVYMVWFTEKWYHCFVCVQAEILTDFGIQSRACDCEFHLSLFCFLQLRGYSPSPSPPPDVGYDSHYSLPPPPPPPPSAPISRGSAYSSSGGHHSSKGITTLTSMIISNLSDTVSKNDVAVRSDFMLFYPAENGTL